jgi:hypothetical protein
VLDGTVGDVTANLGYLEPIEVADGSMPLRIACSTLSGEVPTISATR